MNQEKITIVRHPNATFIKLGDEKVGVCVDEGFFDIELIAKGQADVPRAEHRNMRNKFAGTIFRLQRSKAEALFCALGEMLEKYKV